MPLKAISTAFAQSLSLHMSLQWTQLLFLSLCLLFFLFPFLALMQTPESYSLAHMGLLNRRAKGKKGRGSFSVKFADESLVNVVCEMDATVLHQRRKKERPLAPGHSWGPSNLMLVARAAVDLRLHKADPKGILVSCHNPKCPAPATITLNQILQSCYLIFGFLSHLQEIG